MAKCDVLKISDNEVEFLFGTTDYDKGAATSKRNTTFRLSLSHWEKTEAALTIKDMKVEAAPFLQEKTIETTGAGDTFCASTLNYVLEHGLEDLTEENLERTAYFCKCSSFSHHHTKGCTSRYANQRRSS